MYTRIRTILAMGVLTLVTGLATAQTDFPKKPIRWIVGYPSGAASDFVARTIANAMSSQLGQAIIIENRAGSSGIIASDILAKSAADGYTVGTVDNGMLIFNTALYKKLPYEPVKDFSSVGLMVRLPMLILSHPDSEYRTINDVVDAMRRGPGKVSYAAPGVGTPHNLAMEMFKDQNKLFAVAIQYRGGAPMVQDVLGKHMDLMVLDIASTTPLINSNKVRPLVVFSKNRLPSQPSVPTTFELGIGNNEAAAWQGLAVPSGTPESIKRRLSEALFTAVNSAEVRRKLSEYGAEPLPSTAEAMTDLWKKDYQYWTALIKSRGISAE